MILIQLILQAIRGNDGILIPITYSNKPIILKLISNEIVILKYIELINNNINNKE